MNEKQLIEKATADAFVQLYNIEMKTSFGIVEYSDAPDILCKDADGKVLNFEITLTEDRSGDIQAALGRSEHKSIEALKRQNALLRAGKANIFDFISGHQGNVMEMLLSRIRHKLTKDYGKNVALVVRNASCLDWDWDAVLDQVRTALASEKIPFDKGIWILSYQKDRIFRLV